MKSTNLFKASGIALFTLAALGMATPAMTPAMAAGGGGDSSEVTCTNGKVYDKKTKKCVEKQSLNDQESIFDGGRQLAYAGDYMGAIELLKRAPDQSDERVLNMLGYSHRKLGMVETGIAYYKHSIAMNPEYALVREYYGEALLEQGDVAAAKNQLAEIERICGTDCEAYTMLHAHIDAAIAGGPAVPNRYIR